MDLDSNRCCRPSWSVGVGTKPTQIVRRNYLELTKTTNEKLCK
jgi:hypothetical protein